MDDAEPVIRFAAFVGVLAAMLLAEAVWPRRDRLNLRRRRWPSNLGIVALDTLLVRLVAPLGVVGAALFADARGIGLFNAVAVPGWLAVVASFVLLDLAVWAQHVAFHKVPLFWRFHRMHHADTDIDATTGLRFHPGEILLSLAIKAGVVVLLGAPAAAVVAFEIALNATSLWNHANLRLPARIDALVRRVLVTPDMHRVHHSWRPEETNSNYGFNFPWWDRLFGSYRAQPADGHAGMTIGLPGFRDPAELRLDRMLTQPFR
jgi:sterol desaturase/sphingolipid hydroxylase (fatty acid hydroxylase superfamily)